MPEYEIDAEETSIEDVVPDNETVENIKYVGDTEIVTTEEAEGHTCDECGESFDSEQALNGHKSSH